MSYKNKTIEELAKECRIRNLGYDDGEEATLADIEERLERYERHAISYGTSVANLSKRVSELEADLRTARLYDD